MKNMERMGTNFATVAIKGCIFLACLFGVVHLFNAVIDPNIEAVEHLAENGQRLSIGLGKILVCVVLLWALYEAFISEPPKSKYEEWED